MSQQLLAISIGNTRTQFGVFTDFKLDSAHAANNDKPLELERSIEEALAAINEDENPAILLGSVNPKIETTIDKLLTDRFGRKYLRVEKDITVPIGRQLDRESLVGDDRLLNAAAAFDTLKQACIVVDAGTAITIDFIDGQGTFHGGAISPGAKMMLHAMNQDAAQLPDIEFAKPDEPIGHNTTQAMRCGVYHGMRGLVHELTEVYAEHIGAFPLVIATGGDAGVLFEDDPRVDRVVDNLALLGLATTLKLHQKTKEEEA